MSRVTQKGQWTIPREVRRTLNIIEGQSNVTIEALENGLFKFKVVNPSPLDELIGVASGKGLVKSTDELLKLTRADDN